MMGPVVTVGWTLRSSSAVKARLPTSELPEQVLRSAAPAPFSGQPPSQPAVARAPADGDGVGSPPGRLARAARIGVVRSELASHRRHGAPPTTSGRRRSSDRGHHTRGRTAVPDPQPNRGSRRVPDNRYPRTGLVVLR